MARVTRVGPPTLRKDGVAKCTFVELEVVSYNTCRLLYSANDQNSTGPREHKAPIVRTKRQRGEI